jgi:hypothetical protein
MDTWRNRQSQPVMTDDTLTAPPGKMLIAQVQEALGLRNSQPRQFTASALAQRYNGIEATALESIFNHSNVYGMDFEIFYILIWQRRLGRQSTACMETGPAMAPLVHGMIWNASLKKRVSLQTTTPSRPTSGTCHCNVFNKFDYDYFS